jgi:predicted nucleic acid-binding protein
MILDSTYLFDLMAEDPGAFEKGTELVDRGEMQWLPTPVVAEVYHGVATERSSVDAGAVRNRLLSYPRVDLNNEMARVAGELLAAADDAAGGESGVGWNDAHIAAAADILDDSVLTENVEDFERLGVPVETY